MNHLSGRRVARDLDQHLVWLQRLGASIRRLVIDAKVEMEYEENGQVDEESYQHVGTVRSHDKDRWQIGSDLRL